MSKIVYILITVFVILGVTASNYSLVTGSASGGSSRGGYVGGFGGGHK